MNTNAMWMVSAAILILLGCVGIGIAQGGTPMDSRPVWSIDEQIETGNLPEPTLLAPSPERESLMQGPVETGGVPAMVDEDTEIEGNTFLKGRIIHSEDD